MEKGQKGYIKKSPEDFIVDEVPLYPCVGHGQHIYIKIRKTLLTTDDLISKLTMALDINRNQIGYAGLKDKYAITSQYFSLDLGEKVEIESIRKNILSQIHGIEILSITRHTQKLKRGHLLGNEFRIFVRCNEKGVLEKLDLIKNRILKLGMPNYYGRQRFGDKNNNHIIGEKIILGETKIKNRFRKKIYLQAYQSHLFNQWLDYKILTNYDLEFDIGDYVMDHDRARPRIVTENNKEDLKKESFYLTGILYGKNNLKYLDDNDLIFLKKHNITLEKLKQINLDGGRRLALVFPKELEITESENGYSFKFFLPKGSYATTLLNMFFLEIINDW